MFTKFKNIRDEELVFRYKANKDSDIELELISRYKIHSKKLASELYLKYKYVFVVEYEDIFAIVLSSLFTSIKSFKHNSSFFKLWKTIATNDINIYVSTLPLLKFKGEFDIISTSRDVSLASPHINENNINLSDDIERILVQNKDQFDPKDRDIFILLVAGYTIRDIANETGLKYHYVRSRISVIKDQLEKYFVHS